jgi:outer membrane protein assembly factor BamB
MKLMIIIGILVLFVSAGYAVGFIGGPYPFILLFPVTATAVFVLAFFVIFLILRTTFRIFLSYIVTRELTNKGSLSKAINVLSGFISLVFLIVLTATMFADPHKSMVDNTPGIDVLRSIPYVAWTPMKKTIDQKGVVKYDSQKAYNGINICASIGDSNVYLIDMKGKVLHQWSARSADHKWHEEVEVYPNGDLLAIGKDRVLTRFDWKSNVKWLNDTMQYHHEITIAENGDIYALGKKDDIVIISGFPVPILNNYIIQISAEGKTKKIIPLFNPVKKDIPFGVVAQIYRWIIKPGNIKGLSRVKKKYDHLFRPGTVFDIFHNNTITILDRDISGLCKKKDFLICVRNLDMIYVLDSKAYKVVWNWSPGLFSRPHNPTLLENGNILIFDNGRTRDYSRVIELEPITKTIVWEYKSAPPQDFYTEIRGGCQRLPNGNTLITESNKGHVFEVTKEGEIVWDFYHPAIDLEAKRRAVIYRMERLTNHEKYSFLKAKN